MRLEYVADLVLVYRDEPDVGGKFRVVQPYGGEEGRGYGEGDGTITGDRLRGNVRWVNHPHRRSDGVMLPDAHGIIRTDDGAFVMFSLQGRTVFHNDAGGQLLTATFESDAAPYRWLNTTWCVAEGVIDGAKLSMRARIYSCRNELLEHAQG